MALAAFGGFPFDTDHRQVGVTILLEVQVVPTADMDTVHISRWNHLHFQQDRDPDLSVIRVEREAAKGSKRHPRVSWFGMLDESDPLPHIEEQYRRRFSQAHGSRFLKQ